MRYIKRFRESKDVLAKRGSGFFLKQNAKRLALAVLLIALAAGVSLASASSVARAAVPDWGSKTCIAYCEVNGWLEKLGFSKSEHAQAHNPQASASCPLTPSIRDAEHPRP
ncbi:MAG: hypothetical protein HYX90_07485 [Chloroflexi bacterium]|nr:hypothetical protein [Chloroflexota bacterium]